MSPEVKKINLGVDSAISTPEEISQTVDRLQKNEQAPSARAQSDQYRFFQEQISVLGQPYDVTRIPISVLQQMQRDPMLAFGLHFIHLPIMRANWYVKCERPDIAAFMDNAWRRIHAHYVSQRQQAMVFGFAPIVKRFQLEIPNWTYEVEGEQKKVWNNGNINAITWKPFVGLPSDPVNVEPRWDAKGQFNGIKWQGGANPLPFPITNPSDTETGAKEIDVQHALWITNEKPSANGSLWGYPRIGYAYRYWWSYWFKWALYDRFFERKADPPYVVYYPSGQHADYTDDNQGNKQSMKAIALSIGDAAKSGGTVAMPGETINGYDDRPTSIRQWMIEELEVKGDMTHFVESFEYLDVMKLRSLWIAEQAVMEGKGGTSSRNVAAEEISLHKEGAANLASEIDQEINRYIFPDILKANFPDFNGTCEKVTTGFTEADQQTLNNALNLIGQNDSQALRNLDVREILDRQGLPLISIEEINRQNEEAEKELQNSTPPVVDPNAQAAGVNEQGFYVPPVNIITLSDTEEFISKLPGSKHYEDSTVLSQAKALKQRWQKEYANIYEDFATFLSKENFSEEVNLADEADELAEQLVSKWSYSRNKLKTLLSDTKSISQKIIDRAGKLEIKRAKLDVDKWNPDNESLAQYLEDRGAVYVRAVDETTKEEIRTYLAQAIRQGATQQELVEGVREHFSEFPSWKANRLVRTEIRDAYNFATILAGEQGGVKVVQIIDAVKGEDVSDPECIERNGKFFSIGDALSEALKEHPNGTAEIRLTKRQNLSVEYIQDSDKLAYFDEENDIVYLSNDIPHKLEFEYLNELGKTFEAEST